MGERATPAEPERVLMQLFGYPFRLQRVLAAPEGLHDGQSSPNQDDAREGTPHPRDALVSQHRNEGMDAVLRAQLIAPPSRRRGADEADSAYVTDLHAAPCETPRVIGDVTSGYARLG